MLFNSISTIQWSKNMPEVSRHISFQSMYELSRHISLYFQFSVIFFFRHRLASMLENPIKFLCIFFETIKLYCMKKQLLLFPMLVASLIAITPAFATDKTVNPISTKAAPAVAAQGIPVVGSFANGSFAGALSIVQFIQ